MKIGVETDPEIKTKNMNNSRLNLQLIMNGQKHKITYKNNKPKAFALLWEHSTKGMKNKLKAQLDFKIMKIIQSN